jgi:hypothetical protein
MNNITNLNDTFELALNKRYASTGAGYRILQTIQLAVFNNCDLI